MSSRTVSSRTATSRKVSPNRLGLVGSLASVVILLSLPTASLADDRDLLRSRNSRPYVFTIIDTSSSMTDLTTGDATVASGDDPQSRLYLAKSALYEVVGDTELQQKAIFGWAHFNYENLFVKRLHFAYTRPIGSPDPAWFGEMGWPIAGQPLMFGDPDDVDGGDNNYKSCSSPEDTSDVAKRIARLNMFPKLGQTFSAQTNLFVELNGNDWQITIGAPVTGAIGDTSSDGKITVPFTVVRCDGSAFYTEDLVLEPYFTDSDSDGEPIPGFRIPDGNGGTLQLPSASIVKLFDDDWPDFGDQITDRSALSACHSDRRWDATDPVNLPSSDLSYPRYNDPLNRGSAFARGDMIPWDWIDYDNRYDADGVKIPPPDGFKRTAAEEILARLAPNTVVDDEFVEDADGHPIPDFRVARYFDHTAPLIDNYKVPLKAQFQDHPPIAYGSGTPLAGALEDFGEWFDDWKTLADRPAAQGGDPNYDCRQRFVILLTDGKESCHGEPGDAARALYEKGVRTFVIGFGEGLSGKLDDIADEGGTGATDLDGDGLPECANYFTEDDDGNGVYDCAENGPPLAEDRDELVAILKQLVGATGEQTSAATFTAGGVPSAKSFTPFSAFFTNFYPLEKSSTWHGRVSHFIRPLSSNFSALVDPLSTDRCDDRNELFCLAWEANTSILGLDSGSHDQVPSLGEVADGDFRVGPDPGERRILYGVQPSTSTQIGLPARLFVPTADEPARSDLMLGLGLEPSDASADEDLLDVVVRTLIEKTSPNAFIGKYILGESLHAEATLVGGPSNTLYLKQAVDGDDADNYSDFFERHRTRRRILLVPSSDGQLHGLDAGTFSEEEAPAGAPPYRTPFLNGSGQEIFSYIPRMTLPRVRRAAQSKVHELGIDGTPVVDDFFIDPRHAGTPDPDDREWRTVAVGGQREGGSGYYALDLTQPDKLVDSTITPDLLVPEATSSYVPSCMTSYTESDCGALEYPRMLWEFLDLDGAGTARDDDGNGGRDLGLTWSKPTTGRIRVKVANPGGPETLETRYVAIFGGGLDPGDPRVGNWIYMVDMETGRAIYKRPVIGAVASDTAAVDSDLDTYLDTIYVGTVAGYMYKVDLSNPQLLESSVTGPQVTSPAWDPFPIFNTQGGEIYIPPGVVYARDLRGYVLTFGTGNRENLFKSSEIHGRFIALRDTFSRPIAGPPPPPNTDTDQLATDVNAPITKETDLVRFATNAPPNVSDDLLTGGGYVIELAGNERLISRPFAISGLLLFNTFIPDLTGASGDSCSGAGVSNVYTLLITNGDALGTTSRFKTISGFVSQPFGSTSTRPPTDKDLGDEGASPADQPRIDSIRNTLKDLMPDMCRFNNLSIEMRANRSDTGIEYVAEVPVCFVERNWKSW